MSYLIHVCSRAARIAACSPSSIWGTRDTSGICCRVGGGDDNHGPIERAYCYYFGVAQISPEKPCQPIKLQIILLVLLVVIL